MTSFKEYKPEALKTGLLLGPKGVEQLEGEFGHEVVEVHQIDPVTALKKAQQSARHNHYDDSVTPAEQARGDYERTLEAGEKYDNVIAKVKV